MSKSNYRAKGGGIISNASSSLDKLTRFAMEKLNLNVDYTKQQSAGMAPPPAAGAPPPAGGQAQGPGGQPTPAQQNELKMT